MVLIRCQVRGGFITFYSKSFYVIFLSSGRTGTQSVIHACGAHDCKFSIVTASHSHRVRSVLGWRFCGEGIFNSRRIGSRKSPLNSSGLPIGLCTVLKLCGFHGTFPFESYIFYLFTLSCRLANVNENLREKRLLIVLMTALRGCRGILLGPLSWRVKIPLRDLCLLSGKTERRGLRGLSAVVEKN